MDIPGPASIEDYESSHDPKGYTIGEVVKNIFYREDKPQITLTHKEAQQILAPM